MRRLWLFQRRQQLPESELQDSWLVIRDSWFALRQAHEAHHEELTSPVILGLDPRTHNLKARHPWVLGSSPRMTRRGLRLMVSLPNHAPRS
ncbi:hypothetical protein SAMN05443582_10367 [Phyllobacterium sp. OV277]|nr:hypothetical protein SAMN05443582_10367 [Phyllobacterium sp. OV277]